MCAETEADADTEFHAATTAATTTTTTERVQQQHAGDDGGCRQGHCKYNYTIFFFNLEDISSFLRLLLPLFQTFGYAYKRCVCLCYQFVSY